MTDRRPLHVRILAGLVVGLVAGLAANLLAGGSPAAGEAVAWVVDYVAYPLGQVFLRLLFMIILPLIFTALVLGVAELGDVRKIGRVGVKTLLFTVVVTGISVVIGLGLVNLVQPGAGLSPDDRAALLATLPEDARVADIVRSAEESQSAVDALLEIIPSNPLAAAAGVFDPTYRGGGLLALMFFAIVFGVAMTMCHPERTEGLRAALEGVYDVVMKIIEGAMRLAPYAVAALIFVAAAQLGLAIFVTLARYVAVVLAALAIHQFVTYALILKLFTRWNPLDFFRRISEVMVTAFSTSSSNATLPTSIRVTTHELGVRPDVANFVLTVGSTANQNGTALYEGVTVLFLAQLYGIPLGFGEQIIVVLLSIVAGIGTAGVPGGSLPLVVLVLQQVGVPPEGIGIILGVDRLLDMSRTVVNVTGDVTLAAWVDATEPAPSPLPPATDLGDSVLADPSSEEVGLPDEPSGA